MKLLVAMSKGYHISKEGLRQIKIGLLASVYSGITRLAILLMIAIGQKGVLHPVLQR